MSTKTSAEFESRLIENVGQTDDDGFRETLKGVIEGRADANLGRLASYLTAERFNDLSPLIRESLKDRWRCLHLLADLAVKEPKVDRPTMSLDHHPFTDARMQRICEEPFFWFDTLRLSQVVIYDQSYDAKLDHCLVFRDKKDNKPLWINTWKDDCEDLLQAYINRYGTSVTRDGHLDLLPRVSDEEGYEYDGRDRNIVPVSKPSDLKLKEVSGTLSFRHDSRRIGSDAAFLGVLKSNMCDKHDTLALTHLMEGIDTAFGTQDQSRVVAHMFFVFDVSLPETVPFREGDFLRIFQSLLQRLCVHYLWEKTKRQKDELERIRKLDAEEKSELRTFLETVDKHIRDLQVASREWQSKTTKYEFDSVLEWLVRLSDLVTDGVKVNGIPKTIQGNHNQWGPEHWAAANWLLAFSSETDADVDNRLITIAEDMVDLWKLLLFRQGDQIRRKTFFARLLEFHKPIHEVDDVQSKAILGKVKEWRDWKSRTANFDSCKEIPLSLIAFCLGDQQYLKHKGMFDLPREIGTRGLSGLMKLRDALENFSCRLEIGDETSETDQSLQAISVLFFGDTRWRNIKEKFVDALKDRHTSAFREGTSNTRTALYQTIGNPKSSIGFVEYGSETQYEHYLAQNENLIIENEDEQIQIIRRSDKRLIASFEGSAPSEMEEAGLKLTFYKHTEAPIERANPIQGSQMKDAENVAGGGRGKSDEELGNGAKGGRRRVPSKRKTKAIPKNAK